MGETKILAFIGKGGVGKTVLSAIAGKIFINKGKRVLFVDADPAMGLATAHNVENHKTIGMAREEIIKNTKTANSKEEKDGLPDMTDYLLMEALYEGPEFSMIIMGQTDSLGCFCPVNKLLRGTISSIASNYEIVIIDAEAGFEQVNRQVIEKVQYPIIISDNTVRGITPP